MKKIFTLSAVFSFTLGLLPGCSPDPVAPSAICLLTGVETFQNQTFTLTYDNHQRPIKTLVNLVAGDDYYEQYEYDPAGRMRKYKKFREGGDQVDYFTLTYNELGLLHKESYFWRLSANAPYQHEFDRVFEYNPSRQVVKVSTFEPGEAETPGGVAAKYEAFVYDAKGNVTRIKEYARSSGDFVHVMTTEFTYDQGQNPWRNKISLGATAQSLSPNNMLTEKETAVLSNQVKQSTFSYTYGPNGFPSKQVRTRDGVSHETNFAYSCS
jgi:hypothetical protein